MSIKWKLMTVEPEPREFITLEMAEEIFGSERCSKGTLYAAIKRQEKGLPGLEGERFGPIWCVERSKVEAWKLHAKHKPGPAKGSKHQPKTST